jgi:hypothetical protein
LTAFTGEIHGLLIHQQSVGGSDRHQDQDKEVILYTNYPLDLTKFRIEGVLV